MGLAEGQVSDRLTHDHGRRASLSSITLSSLHVQSPSAEQEIPDQIAPKLQGQVRASQPSGVSRWLNTVKPEAPAGKAIFDNSAAHRHPWLIDGLKRRPQWTLHFTPTSAPGSMPSRALSPSFPSVVPPVAASTRRRSPGRRQPLRRGRHSAAQGLLPDRRSRQNHRRSQPGAQTQGFIPQRAVLGDDLLDCPRADAE